MKKHGGPAPCQELLPPRDPSGAVKPGASEWRADGAPFLRLQFRPAQYTPAPPADDAALRSAAAAAALPASLPEALLRELAAALRGRDSEAFARTMESLEGFDQPQQDYDERVALFRKRLQDILLNPALMAEGGALFVLEAIEAKLRGPPPGAPGGPQGRGDLGLYRGADEQRLAPGRDRKMFRSQKEMAFSTCNVLQPPSYLDEWESVSTMGHHPGVLFGAHCCSTLAHTPLDQMFGGFVPEPAARFGERYPSAALATFQAYEDSD